MKKETLLNGKKMVYHLYGSGRPVVLLHGFGETSEVWVNQVSVLKDKFHLIVPDLPGSGGSESTNDMSMAGLARTVKRLLDAILPVTDGNDPPKITLVGHSMGGYVTLAFAEEYPQHLHALGLFHSTAYPDSEEKKETRRKGIAFIKKHGAFEFLKTATPNLFSPVSREKDADFIIQYIETLSNFSATALVSYYEAMIQRPDRSHVLKTKGLPVLFIMGKYDTAVPPEDGLKLCRLPEISYIHILRLSGHMGMLEEVEKINFILEQFLSES